MVRSKRMRGHKESLAHFGIEKIFITVRCEVKKKLPLCIWIERGQAGRKARLTLPRIYGRYLRLPWSIATSKIHEKSS